MIKKPKNLAWSHYLSIVISAEILMFFSFTLGFKLNGRHVVILRFIIGTLCYILSVIAVALLAYGAYNLITSIC